MASSTSLWGILVARASQVTHISYFNRMRYFYPASATWFVAFIFLINAPFDSWSQKYTSVRSEVKFFSKASIEDIAAVNSKGVSILNVQTGEVAFSIPVKEFKFEKSLMETHFNEKYLETEKFPRATFEGTITGYPPTATGPQKASASGKLTLHGVTRSVDATGTIEFIANSILLHSKFMVRLEDYSISRPRLLWQNLAEEVEVSIDFTYTPYEK